MAVRRTSTSKPSVNHVLPTPVGWSGYRSVSRDATWVCPSTITVSSAGRLGLDAERLGVGREVEAELVGVEAEVGGGVVVGTVLVLGAGGQVLRDQVGQRVAEREAERLVGAADGLDRVAQEVEVVEVGDLR